MSAMDQYRTLWKEKEGAPPYMLNIFNNFYAMGGQPSGETMGCGLAARVGLGVNPEGMHTERVDGFNPLAVADAVERKKKLLLEEGARHARDNHLQIQRPQSLRCNDVQNKGRA